MTANSINFVDENNARSVFLALLKQVADTGGAYTNKHFHKIGPRDREEGNVRFTSDSTGQQGLSGSGRSHQEDTLGDSAPQLLKLLRLAQEIDDFLQFFLGLLHAGHIFKCNLLVLGGKQASAALSE